MPGFFAPLRDYRSLRRNAIRQIIQTSVRDSVCRPNRGGHVGNPTVLAVWRLAAVVRSIENRFTGHFACPRRRLEDRIQDLVHQVVETEDADETRELIARLREALQEHTGRLRKLAADNLVGGGKASRRPKPES